MKSNARRRILAEFWFLRFPIRLGDKNGSRVLPLVPARRFVIEKIFPVVRTLHLSFFSTPSLIPPVEVGRKRRKIKDKKSKKEAGAFINVERRPT